MFTCSYSLLFTTGRGSCSLFDLDPIHKQKIKKIKKITLDKKASKKIIYLKSVYSSLPWLTAQQNVCDEFTLLGQDGSVELKFKQNLIYHMTLSHKHTKFLWFLPFCLICDHVWGKPRGSLETKLILGFRLSACFSPTFHDTLKHNSLFLAYSVFKCNI